jgi:hypothetical protein
MKNGPPTQRPASSGSARMRDPAKPEFPDLGLLYQVFLSEQKLEATKWISLILLRSISRCSQHL